LDCTNLNRTDLNGANPIGSQLNGANLTGSNLNGAKIIPRISEPCGTPCRDVKRRELGRRASKRSENLYRATEEGAQLNRATL